MAIPTLQANPAFQAKAFQSLARALSELCDAQTMMMDELGKNESHDDIDAMYGLLEVIDGRMTSACNYLLHMPDDQLKSSDEVISLFKRVSNQYNETAEKINVLASKAKGKPTNLFPKIDFSLKLDPARVHQYQRTEPDSSPHSDVFQYPQVQPVAKHRIQSFKIDPPSLSTLYSQKTTFLLEKLHLISQLFRNGSESEAMQEFSKVEEATKGKIFELLWIIRGRRQDYPGDFGKDSFAGNVDSIKSSPQQKACAIELFIQQESSKLMIQTMLEELKIGNLSAMKNIFNTLPLQVQGEIFGMHWMVCGEPSDKSRDENLRKMAHGDFGKVSFLDLEARCSVPLSKKVETLEAYLKNLSSFKDERFKLAEQIVKTEVEAWKKIDQSSMKGQEKNDAKRAALFPFANKLVRLFTPIANQDIITIPTLFRPDGSEIKRFEAYAAEYAKKYPCLKPFFLQLVEKLDLQDKGQLLILPVVPYDFPKPLQVPVPTFQHMNPQQRRTYLIDIMKDTLSTLNNGYYINSRAEKVSLDLNPAAQSVYPLSNVGEKARIGPYRTKLFLSNRDCLRVAQDCAERNLNPIVVDAASEDHFGGGYENGAAAQEENLCRRSGLCAAINPFHQVQQKDFYPLTKYGDDAALYVANVPVFRGEEREGYPYLDKPFDAAFAVVAAEDFNLDHQIRKGVQNPKQLLQDTEGRILLPPDSAERTKKKLRTVLEMASLNNHKSLVLVALGCGAFHNPPAQICEIMMELITKEFPHSFEEIHIAIIEDHNSKRSNSPRGNFVEFKEVIENQFTPKLQKEGIEFHIVN